MGQQVLAVKDYGKDFVLCSEAIEIPAQIDRLGITLHTMESDFSKRLNNVLRHLTEINMQQIILYRPFCYLLRKYWEQIKSVPEVMVYRGVDLTGKQQQEFMKDKFIFTSFTSATKNRTLAEWINNTLLVI